MKLRLPFAPLVALRFLREGRMQTLLILAGTTGGVAVIIFLTQLISQLQAQIIDRVLGSQAHVVLRPLEEANRPAIADDGFARDRTRINRRSRLQGQRLGARSQIGRGGKIVGGVD